MISNTPKPPYYAVIFTSIRKNKDEEYDKTANQMVEMANKQKGFLGVESSRNEIGITVSYWDSLENIKNWKMQSEHRIVQKKGKKIWYKAFKVRICLVEKDYGFESSE
jgi:heme-degrading monooxygenase HmoA